MRVTVPPPPSSSEDDTTRRATMSGVGYRDAESLFRSKPISEIRAAESTTRSHISQKQEELRLLVGTRYRDLIDSADSILRMKHSSGAISENLSSIQASIMAMSDRDTDANNPDRLITRSRSRIYGIACRVKYLVDTPENIWACLDESMFLEAASRFVRSKHLQLNQEEQDRFPLLQHHCQIVDGFKAQISQRARDRLFLFDGGSLPIESYADALAAVAVVDDLSPARVLSLFLDSRKAWVSHALSRETDDVVSVFCEVLKVIQVTAAQVGELFLRVLNDMPLFYRVVLGSPPASQLFGGIPDPDEEVRLWSQFRDKLESAMVVLEKDFISELCGSWLRECGREMVGQVNGRFLIDALGTGQQLAAAEAVIRETMESKEVLEKSLEWLKNVFGSDIELPWSRTRELVLGYDSDLWDDIFEDAFVGRMKVVVDERFTEMTSSVTVVERETAAAAGGGGGVWFVESGSKKVPGFPRGNPSEDNEFKSCLDAYLGPQIGSIRDAVDGCCQSIVEDLLCFLESPKASARLQALAPYLQSRCYESLSSILKGLRDELRGLESENNPVTVERALFIGRLVFAFLNHSRHVPVVLGPPRFWAKEAMSAVFDRLPSLMRRSAAGADSPTGVALDSPGRKTPTSARRQTSLATTALLGAGEIASPQLEELTSSLRELCIRAHGLWILWLSNELSIILSSDLEHDDALSSMSPLRGWEVTVVKQEQSDDNPSEMKILLPSMPSLYVVSFLFRACEEVHRIGGHVLDRTILQKLALSLLGKVISIYGDFISTREVNGSQVSEKGVLQILLDLRFIADVLSGGDSVVNEESVKVQRVRNPFRRKPDQNQTKSAVRKQVDGLITRLSQRLDPIDWLTYEPYLWENERQSYQRHAILFGFFVQLNRMYTDTVQKLPTNSESNIMRCSSVPRFKYLPISAPALSSRGTTKSSLSMASEDISSRSSWKAYTNGEHSENIDIDDNSSFGVATPFLKSFMQVGSKFGGSTLKLGSILTDGQVGIFKDRSTSAMSTFGDILPAQAAGLLSSFTASKLDP